MKILDVKVGVEEKESRSWMQGPSRSRGVGVEDPELWSRSRIAVDESESRNRSRRVDVLNLGCLEFGVCVGIEESQLKLMSRIRRHGVEDEESESRSRSRGV